MERVKNETLTYRQKAALLVAPFVRTNAVASQVAHNLLEHHPGYVPASLLEDEAPTKTKKNEIFLPICRTCGAALQPGYHGTKIRFLQRAAAIAKTKTHNDNRSHLALYVSKKQSLGSNVAILVCGSCGAKREIPGMPEQRPAPKPPPPAAPPNQPKPKRKKDDYISLSGRTLAPPPKKKKKKNLLKFLSSLND